MLHSIRDLANKLPDTKQGLEHYVLSYDADLKDRVERSPRGQAILEDVVNKSFERYSPYIGGVAQKIAGAGRAVGYSADAWFLGTGDIVGSLGGQALDLIAQIPEKAYSIAYAVKTGDYLGSMQNIFEGFLSYLPGFTIADQGLGRIVQKRMVKSAVYDLRKRLATEDLTSDPSRQRPSVYTDVKDRRKNIISPHYKPGKTLAA